MKIKVKVKTNFVKGWCAIILVHGTILPKWNSLVKNHAKEQNTKKKKKKTMAPFYGWGSTGSRLEPLRGGSLLFTTTFPEIPATHVIDHGRMSQFWSQPVVLNTGPLDGESSALTNRPLLKIQLGTIVPISLGNNCAMCQGCSTWQHIFACATGAKESC